ncbi:hypothetical protein VTJ49DRAFT_7200 [Mycothermus thermophilus]|uniref:Lytic polysaccharide monooxygenase n=1 Tax=Humicola insolens TaxID=85995 RepID=A0ABR3VPP0_HUMIN
MSSLLSTLILLGGVGGHMVMNTPTPYNLDMAPFLQVDPLDGINHPFPCHNKFSSSERTPVEAGTTTLVNFTGAAQHGGGSCQFSITYDEPVDGGNWNKTARFMTVYSIIGGCPAVFTDESRNLPGIAVDKNMRQDSIHCGNDSGIDCIRQFMIPIPKFLKNGPATFAWTWFNKLGNKEMYMNCAPINITGGTGDEKQMAYLPDIFIANYHNDPEVPNCNTGGNGDHVVVNFPNPGRYGRVLQNPVEPSVKPAGYCTQILPAKSIPTFETELVAANIASWGLLDQATPTYTLPYFTPTTEVHSLGGDVTPLAVHPPRPVPTRARDPNNPITDGEPYTIYHSFSLPDPSASIVTTITLSRINRPPPDRRHGSLVSDVASASGIPTANMPIAADPRHGRPSRSFIRISVPATVTVTGIHDPTGFVLPNATTPNYPGPTDAAPNPRDDAIPCFMQGQYICFNQTHAGHCNQGWAVPHPVANGTTCTNGKIIPRQKRRDDDVKDGGILRVAKPSPRIPRRDDRKEENVPKRPKPSEAVPKVPEPSPRIPRRGRDEDRNGGGDVE